MFTVNSSKVSKSPCLLAPTCFLLETRKREMQVTQDPHHHYYNFTLSSTQVPPLLLPCFSELNAWITFPKHPTRKRKRPPSELGELADERREIKSIFKAVLWLACRTGSLSSCLSVTSSQTSMLSLRGNQSVPQNQYRNNFNISLQTLDFCSSEEKTRNRDGEFSEEN